MTDIISALIEHLGEQQVILGADLTNRATSYWRSEPTQTLALLRPRSTNEVSQILKLCHAHNQPVVVQGGLTGCVDGAISTEQEIIISLERMNRIESIDPVGGTVTVEAGVILETLHSTLANEGLMFPLDLGARGSCTIGGNIATNAGGINVLRYGMMRELVLGLEAVLADGTVISSMNQMIKNNAGYDIKQLFIGSEGTLGVVTRAVVKIHPRSKSRDSAMVGVQDFEAVTGFLQYLRGALGGTLSAFEVMWGEYFCAVTEPGWHRPPMQRDHPFYIMIETEGSDPESDAKRFSDTLEHAFETGLISDAVVPKSEAERKSLWDVRENFEAILEKQPYYLYDVSLPIKDMPAYVSHVQNALQDQFTLASCYVLGHVADGNLHLFLCPGEPGDWHQVCDKLVYSPLKNFEGSISAEHGIGTEKISWLGISRSESEIALMRQLKAALDPNKILGAERVIPPAES